MAKSIGLYKCANCGFEHEIKSESYSSPPDKKYKPLCPPPIGGCGALALHHLVEVVEEEDD